MTKKPDTMFFPRLRRHTRISFMVIAVVLVVIFVTVEIAR